MLRPPGTLREIILSSVAVESAGEVVKETYQRSRQLTSAPLPSPKGLTVWSEASPISVNDPIIQELRGIK